VAKKHDQAVWLAQMLTERAGAPVTVAWEGEGVGRGDWWVRWTDGPTTGALRAWSATQQPFLRPLDIAGLRWGRTYSPQAWALALVDQHEADPQLSDWRELLGLAEAWLDDADRPDRADDVHTLRATRLRATVGDRESALARAVLATDPTPVVTKPGDETRCVVCAGPVTVHGGAGRPARYCSPACRTRAWRQRNTPAVTKTGDVTPCPVCGNPIPARTGAGRPGRYCSPACRTRAWRQRTHTAAAR
jgi:hypothetical protein